MYIFFDKSVQQNTYSTCAIWDGRINYKTRGSQEGGSLSSLLGGWRRLCRRDRQPSPARMSEGIVMGIPREASSIVIPLARV